MAASLAAFVLAAMAATGLEPAGPPLADLRQVAARADRLGAVHLTSRSGYLVALPSLFPGPPAGSFAVVTDQAGEGVSSQGHAGVLAIALATALGAALLISLLVKRHLSKSTLALAQVAQRVGDTKDFSIRASVTGGPEVRQLVRGFNEMLSRMEEHERALRGSEERFRQVAETIREVFWITDVTKHQMVYISPGYEVIWGRPCASLYDRPEAWLDAIHERDRERVEKAARTLQQTGEYHEIYRIVRPDGATRWIQDRAFPIRNEVGMVYRVAGIAEDISERKAAENRLAAQHAVIQALAESGSLEQAAQKILRSICECLDWEMGALWRVEPSGLALSCVDLWGAREICASDFGQKTRHGKFALAEGFPGRVWAAGKVVWIPDLAAEDTFPRAAFAIQTGLHAALGFPVLSGGRVMGVAEFFSRQIREPEPALLQLMSGLGNQIGQFIASQRASEAVRQAEAKYRSIYENAAEGIFQTTPDGRYLSANRALARILGYESPDELIEMVTDLGAQLCVDPQSRKELKSRLEAEGSVREFENQIYRKDGTIIWTSVNARVVRDAQGNVLYYEGTSQDITARKQADLQLAMLAHAVESTGEMICITDLNDRFIFANRAFQRAYGYAEAEILGNSPGILFAPSNRPGLIEEILQQSRAGGWRGEVIDRRKDGSEFPVFLSTSQLRDPAGQLIGLMGVAQDITERKRAETQIRLLADAVHSANEMISITDEQNRFTFVNQAFLNAYGYSETEVLGRTPEFLYSSRNTPGLCQQVFEETRRGAWSGEILNCRKDRSEFPIALSTSPIKTGHGLLGLVGVARDITERKRAEKQTTAFSWLGYRLSAATTPLQAADIIMRVASELFGLDAGYCHLYDEGVDELVPVLTMDTVDGQRVAVSSATFTRDPSPLMRQVMQQGARLVNRHDSPELRQLVPFGNLARRSESMMYVPIHSSGTVLGILSIQSYSPRAYSENDLVLLQALADQCGGALQRIRVTEALRESERRFRALFESAPIGIALHDSAGRFVHVNAAYQRMVGYSESDLRQLTVMQITHPDDVGEGRRLFDDLREGKRDGYQREKRYLRRDGQVVWAQTSASTLRNAGGEFVYIISMVEDITDRRMVLQALQESERKLRLIAENTRDVIFAFDMERRPVYVNQAVSELSGYTFAELQQHPFLDWVQSEDRGGMLEHWKALYEGQAQSEVEFRMITRSGEVKWCSSSWGPLLDESGRQIGVQGHVRDISERKQLEREVLESTANERRRIGHELHDGLGQYLAGIAFRAKAFEQTLGRAGTPFDREAGELVSLISNAISQTRSLARGLDPVDVETIGLPAALQNLASETRKFFDVGCQFNCPDTRLALDSQTALSLYRIVQEAIHNAIRHGEASQIEIGFERRTDHLVLRVHDDGVGFEVGQANASGMGLRVMQYRARSIGGNLEILSQRNQGTQIRCEVPLREMRS